MFDSKLMSTHPLGRAPPLARSHRRERILAPPLVRPLLIIDLILAPLRFPDTANATLLLEHDAASRSVALARPTMGNLPWRQVVLPVARVELRDGLIGADG